MIRLFIATLAVAGLAAGTAGARSDVYVAFRTPSGNIGCGFDHLSGEAAHLRCDIRSGLHNPSPVKPRGCDLEYGDSLAMGRTGRPGLVCHGDTALDPRARVIPYGSAWSREGFRCRSQISGLTCTNPAGHGFFLSRERWRTF